jgi:hypothetical protein
MNVHDDTTRCEWARDSIDAYLDGELTNVDVTVLESHMNECGMCREELASARRVLTELRELPAKRCPDGVTDRLYATIGADTTVHRDGRLPRWLTARPFGLLRPVLVGSLILVIAVSAIWFDRHNRSSGDSRSYTPEEVAQAEAELKWTMAFLGDVGRRTGYAVRDEVVGARVVEPVRRAVHSVMEGGVEVTPRNNGG